MTLDKLISKIARKIDPPPPPVYEVVDMRPFFARMNIGLIAHHDGAKKPHESDLTGFARALKFRDERELLRVALNDAAEFTKRYIAVKPPRDCFTCASAEGMRQIREGAYKERADEAGDVREHVIRKFVEDEIVHQCLDELVWFGDDRPGLSSARPFRPRELAA